MIACCILESNKNRTESSSIFQRNVNWSLLLGNFVVSSRHRNKTATTNRGKKREKRNRNVNVMYHQK